MRALNIFVLAVMLTACGESVAPSHVRSEASGQAVMSVAAVKKFGTFLPPLLSDISAGGEHICAIDDDEGVKCWGDNGRGETNVPTGLKNPKFVSSGEDHTCAIDDDGVKCWGDNVHGQAKVPEGLKNPKFVSSGYYHTCALDDDGVKCWGLNKYGQAEVPEGLKNPKFVSSRGFHTCALDDDGVKCWGGNGFGQAEVPDGLKNPKFVSSGDYHTCAIDDDGVKCWGDNVHGQAKVPEGLKNPKFVSSGGGHTCAIDDDGVKCWGWNEHGQSNVPEGVKNPRMVSSGGAHTCAIDDEGVKCWGWNKSGQTNVQTLRYSFSWQPWPQILSQFITGDKFQFFSLIQKTIFEALPTSSDLNSKEHQILTLLMTRYVKEFPSDYFAAKIAPIWQRDLDGLAKETGVKSAKDILATPQTLQIAVKLLNSAFIAVKPMLSSSEQHEVEDIILAINETLAGAMTHESVKTLVAKITSHDKLLKAIAGSDAVHMTSVVVEDVTAWITGQ